MIRRLLAVLLLGLTLSLCQADASASNTIGLTTQSELEAAGDSIAGHLTLHLESVEPIYDARIFARGQGAKTLIGQVAFWEPGSSQVFDFDIPSAHNAPGDYHLLVEVAFADQAGARQGLSLALRYRVESDEDFSSTKDEAGRVAVSLDGDRLHWQLPAAGVSRPRLTLTTEPGWTLPNPLTPPAQRIVLEPTERFQVIPNWHYRQLARVDWVQNGRHFSQVSPWILRTDAEGNWQPQASNKSATTWRQGWIWLWGVGLIGLIGVAWSRRRSARQHLTAGRLRTGAADWVGGLALMLLTAWTVSHASPALWLTQTWSTGGDVASHVFYASVFMDWLPSGKISGWLPESFAGFPAFTYYFPFPFTIAALLQFVVGQQVAFKLVSMSPAFLLPAATYGLCWMWGWRVPLRLMAAAGATGFILADATSIWGGNVLAQLAGEFAYSWGMLLAVIFWGALAIALRNGGRWWLLAGALEALVALSHGYALLVAGFGAFAYLLVSRDFLQHLRVILQVHLLAFLLIGFWLIPLIENLRWTIPNDSATAIDSWQTLWPSSLWPLAAGWLPLGLMLARPSTRWPYGVAFLIGICLLGLLGFVAGGRVGLADLRFFPYAQWALAVASGAAIAWTLQQRLPSAALPLVIACLIGLGAWWEPRLDRIEGWSRWNLTGYEAKATWPHYLATAQANAGPLHGPRLIFEHDPANNDLGSTRTLEALPMFGSRPALEGLFMESAVTGPFIYQLQAEISERPSAPLSRYPPSKRSLDAAVQLLNELYVDRVILRSGQKQALFAGDPRFELVAEHGPLQTYALKDLQTQLIEAVQMPLVAAGRDGWLQQAFRRFILERPYEQRTVFLGNDQELPNTIAPSKAAQVRIQSLSRERLTFETDAVGQPHLVRISYHPRWASANGEPIYLVEPSFMLLYPDTSTVTLEYRWSWGNWVGAGASLLGLVLFVIGLRGSRVLTPSQSRGGLSVRDKRLAGFLILCSLLVLAAWWNDPERVYQRGHLRFNQGDRIAAAELFDAAYRGRHGPAQKSEALFWAARSLQLAGKLDQSNARYATLTSDYPESYWYPESGYRLVEIFLIQGHVDAARIRYAQIQKHAPESKWVTEAARLFDGHRQPAQ